MVIKAPAETPAAVTDALLDVARRLVAWNDTPNGDGVGLQAICEAAEAALARATAPRATDLSDAPGTHARPS